MDEVTCVTEPGKTLCVRLTKWPFIAQQLRYGVIGSWTQPGHKSYQQAMKKWRGNTSALQTG